MFSRNASLYILLILAIFIVSIAMSEHHTRSNAAPRNPAITQAPGQLFCDVFCSETVRGTAVAEILWKVSETQLNPQAFQARIRNQGLEVTVFKEGFNKGLYSNLASLDTSNNFRAFRADQQDIPGLDGLVVTDVRSVDDTDESGARESRFNKERVGALPFDPRTTEAVVVRIEGLKPGLNYFWRVPTGTGNNRRLSEVVQCKAPVCPVDLKPVPPGP